MLYYSLQRWTLLSPPDTSTPEHCFHFGSASSFLLELFSLLFYSSMLSTYQPGELIFQCHISLSFHTVHGVFKVRMLKLFVIPFSVDYILSELSTMTCPSWVALCGMVHIELDKAVIHAVILFHFL